MRLFILILAVALCIPAAALAADNIITGNGGDGISITNTGTMTLNLSGNTIDGNTGSGLMINNGGSLSSIINGGSFSGNGTAGIDIMNTGTFSGSIREVDINSNPTGLNLVNTGPSFSMDLGTTGEAGIDPGNNNFGVDGATLNTVNIHNETDTNVPAQGNFWGTGAAPAGGTIVNVNTSTTDTSNHRATRRFHP